MPLIHTSHVAIVTMADACCRDATNENLFAHRASDWGLNVWATLQNALTGCAGMIIARKYEQICKLVLTTGSLYPFCGCIADDSKETTDHVAEEWEG